VAAVTSLANVGDKGDGASTNAPMPASVVEVGLLTGGCDKPYAFGLATALASKGVTLDFIGSDELDDPELHTSPTLRFLNLRGCQRQDASFARKGWRILVYYVRLVRYASVAEPRIFHILWNNKFQTFDRTLLMLYYKLLGKKIVFTAHNVNAGKRDANDSTLNRLTLRIQYFLSDHVFVHTEQMKSELLRDFGIGEKTVTVIPFGINNAVPHTDVTPAEAREYLGIRSRDKTVLFFGNIEPYKGLQFLAEAFHKIAVKDPDLRLIIAGRLGKACERYLQEVRQTLSREVSGGQVIQAIGYIPDEDAELYFKAADILVLPYTHVFQSGVLFLGYSFGLPVIATDVGSLGEEIVEARTGFLCRPSDAADLARALEKYFESDLCKTLNDRRAQIQDYANARHSWDVVGDMTASVYSQLLADRESHEKSKA
jgi:D-inositol-3-phosphate glycosyltransferase